MNVDFDWIEKHTGPLTDAQKQTVERANERRKFAGVGKSYDNKWYPIINIGHKDAAVLESGFVYKDQAIFEKRFW